MALTIDPDDVPRRMFLVFEDDDLDRWMASGQVDVQNSDGSAAVYDLDDGSGGAFRIGTDTGVLFFRLDLDGSGIVTGTTGPTVDAALPADTATEKYFPVANIASTAAGDFTQQHEGPMRWQNSGQPGRWGTQPIIFTKDDGMGGTVEVARILMDRGNPVIPGGGLEIQVDAGGVSYPTSYTVTASEGTFGVKVFDFDFGDPMNRYYRDTVDADLILHHDTVTGAAWVVKESTGDIVLQKLTFDTATAAGGPWEAGYFGEDEYNGGDPWTASSIETP